MEGKRRNRPRALLVFGAPASGKTTFAEKFAKKFGLAYYNFADLMDEHDFSYDAILVILSEILKTGQTIVMKGVWILKLIELRCEILSENLAMNQLSSGCRRILLRYANV